MTKRRIVLEVDDVKVFDAIKKGADIQEALGQRLVMLMLGEASFIEATALLGVYGVEIKEHGPKPVEKTEELPFDEHRSGMPFGGQSL